MCYYCPQCVLKQREFAMWICDRKNLINEPSTLLITGPMKTLLLNAAHFMIYDMVGFDLPQDMRNKKIIEEVIQTLNQEDEIIAELNPIFENLSPFEKIYATHYVLTNFFNNKIKAPYLSLWMKSTIDVLFNIILSNIKCEIDDEDEIDQEEFKYRIRKLLIEAAKQYSPEKNIRKKNIEKTKKVDFWIDQIEILKEEILLDDDVNNISIIENTSKEKRELICDFFGINIEEQYLPTIKIEKKTIVKMINDILKMK
jgi:hypothetical protein